MKKLILLTALIAVTIASPAAFAGGVAHGKAGDGVYVNGQLIMRDFIVANTTNGAATPVTNNKIYLENMPGFMPLFKQIAAADSIFAAEIWGQLNEATIWLIPAKLPLLPKSETTLIGRSPQVQIAIRDGNDIMISTTAMAKLPPDERPYELIHEAIHGLIDGNGPMHETRVMAMTRWLHDNAGHYTTASIDNVMNRLDVNYSTTDTEIAVGVWHLDDYNRVLAVFLEQKGTAQSLCLLKQVMSNVGMGSNLFGDASNYGPDNCPKQDAIAVLKSNSPVLGQLLGNPFPNYYNDDLSLNDDIYLNELGIEKLGKYGSPSKDDCHKSANPTTSGRIVADQQKYTALVTLANQGKQELAQIQSELDSDTSQDAALTAAMYVLLRAPSMSDAIKYGINNLNSNILDDKISDTQRTIEQVLPLASGILKDNINMCINKYGEY